MEKLAIDECWIYGKVLRRKLHTGMILRVYLVIIVSIYAHHGTRIYHAEANYVKNPPTFRNQCCTDKDEYKAEHDGSDNRPNEYLMIVFGLHTEGTEYKDHDKYIVDGECIFDDIAGDILERKVVAVYR